MFEHPVDIHVVGKLGKKAPIIDHRTLKLENYTRKLAPAPKECNLTSKMSNVGMMLNDQLGDCTCAGVAHIIQQWTAETGNQVIISDEEVKDLYCKVSGYVPGDDSTDNGAIELDVLNYWRKNPIRGTHSLEAFAALKLQREQQLMNSVYYFGAAYIGVALPISAQNQTIWEVVHGRDSEVGSWGGHAIPIVAYDPKHVYTITWGQFKKMTWEFYLKYAEEAYALLSKDWICAATNHCPTGFQLEDLKQDLKAVITG